MGLSLSDTFGRKTTNIAGVRRESERPPCRRDKSQRSRREQVEGSMKDREARRQKETTIPPSSVSHRPA